MFSRNVQSERNINYLQVERPLQLKYFLNYQQDITLTSMTICVKDLSGSGNFHDPLNVSYIVTGGECVSFLL